MIGLVISFSARKFLPRGIFLPIICLFVLSTAQGQQGSKHSIEIAEAKRFFAEAEELFAADDSSLWGTSLAGPMIFVDSTSRSAVANQADAEKALREVDGVFSGELPADVMIANTSIDWNGTKWTMLLWPLPQEPKERKVLLAHEAWHRIQDSIGFPASTATNDHLNSLEGRYLLQLEWRALSKALRSTDSEQKMAIADALRFRARRHELIAGSVEQETSMELHEGLAEYTGVRMALDPAERIARTVRLLDRRPTELPTFVRSFAYLSGPAYGVLLDQLDEGWLKRTTPKSDLGQLLMAAAKIDLGKNLESIVSERSPSYDGPALWAAEKKRDGDRIAKLTLLSKKFLEGPRLIVSLDNPRMSFDPSELLPLDEAGTVYKVLNITGDWGVLNVSGGALLSKDFSHVIVGVPADYAGELKTAEWQLQLNEGWSVQAAASPTFVIAKKIRK